MQYCFLERARAELGAVWRVSKDMRSLKDRKDLDEGREGKYFSAQKMSHYPLHENPRGSWLGTSTMGPSPASWPCPGRKEITCGYLPPAELIKLKWPILGLKFLHWNLHPTSTKRALYQKLLRYTGTFHSAEGLRGAKPNTFNRFQCTALSPVDSYL